MRRTVLTLAVAVALVAGVDARADAQSYIVAGACRDGQPNGAYELKMPDGRVRVVGAFAKGRRTGTFIFWAANGQRVAVIPYDEDVKSGTVATWYAEAVTRGDLRRKLEASYVRDVLHGLTRSWYASGRLRGEYRYEQGALVEASGWAENGARLQEAEARRMADVDRAAAEKFYADLEQVVAENLPLCG